MKQKLKSCEYKNQSFILANMAGLIWEMLKDGEVFSSSTYGEEGELNNMIAINNNQGVEDNEMLKKKVVAILGQKIHNSVTTMNELAKKAGYKDFEIEYDEIVEMLKLKSYELFEE